MVCFKLEQYDNVISDTRKAIDLDNTTGKLGGDLDSVSKGWGGHGIACIGRR